MALTNTYISLDYFVGDIDIPNTDVLEVKAEVESFVDKYESIFLTELLGYELYKAMQTATTWGPPITATDPFEDLINGAEYTDSNGELNFYEGLSGQDTYKRSPIANYIYWEWMSQNYSQTVGVGEVVSNVENSTRITPIYKMVKAWNDMTDMLWKLHDFIMENESDYITYRGINYPPLSSPTSYSSLLGNQKLFIKQNTLGL